jgi:hypothetical protein
VHAAQTLFTAVSSAAVSTATALAVSAPEVAFTASKGSELKVAALVTGAAGVSVPVALPVVVALPVEVCVAMELYVAVVVAMADCVAVAVLEDDK